MSEFVERVVADVRGELGVGARSEEAQQLRRLLAENPDLSTVSRVREFVVYERHDRYRTPELDSVAAVMVGWSPRLA